MPILAFLLNSTDDDYIRFAFNAADNLDKKRQLFGSELIRFLCVNLLFFQ